MSHMRHSGGHPWRPRKTISPTDWFSRTPQRYSPLRSFNVLGRARMGTMVRSSRAKRLGTVARSTRCGRGPAALRQRRHSRFAFMARVSSAFRVHGELQRSEINGHRTHEPVRSARGRNFRARSLARPAAAGDRPRSARGGIRDSRSWRGSVPPSAFMERWVAKSRGAGYKPACL
jgi:hypothetical protein